MPRLAVALCLLACGGVAGASAQAPAEPQMPVTVLPAPDERPLAQSSPAFLDLLDVAAPEPKPVTASYSPGDGVTVSMLNGASSIKLFATFSTIGAFNTSRPFPAGPPLFLFPPAVTGLPTNTFDLAARQSSLGAAFTGPDVCGWQTGAFFLAFIQNDNLTADAYGFLPYNAYAELKKDDWRFTGGLQSDVFNPVNPTLISLLKLFASGNTGSFRGQARLEHYYRANASFQLTSQFALSEPISNIITNSGRFIEDNGWPNVEGRLAAGFGEARDLAGGRKQRCVELGVSGIVGQLRNVSVLPPTPEGVSRSTVDVWGLGADLQAAITTRFGLAAEVFVGQSLGEYNGMISQNFGADLRAIRGSGGFGEAYYYFTDKLHLHAGYGLDAPVVHDLARLQIARNQTYYTTLVWNISRTLQLSFEVDWRKTDFVTFDDAEGATIVSELLWKF